MEPLPGASAAVDMVYRSDWGRIVATLIRLVGDFDVAEEAAQDAFAAAVEQWAVSGVPAFPRAWLVQTARHKAIDRIRRRARFAEKLDTYAASELDDGAEPADHDPDQIPDDPRPGSTKPAISSCWKTRIGAVGAYPALADRDLESRGGAGHGRGPTGRARARRQARRRR